MLQVLGRDDEINRPVCDVQVLRIHLAERETRKGVLPLRIADRILRDVDAQRGCCTGFGEESGSIPSPTPDVQDACANYELRRPLVDLPVVFEVLCRELGAHAFARVPVTGTRPDPEPYQRFPGA